MLALEFKQNPSLRKHLRVIDSWGPWPIQPIVVRQSLPQKTKKELREALTEVAENPQYQRALARYLVTGFGPIVDADFVIERRVLKLVPL